MAKKVVLKAGKEKSLLRQHPWIFSGAIASLPSFEFGEVLSVYSSEGIFLAQAYFHPTNSLAGRVLSFQQGSVYETIKQNILNSISLRESLKLGSSYRLIHAEGDDLPGLIVDKYEDILVLQINTYGMERLKPFIIETLAERFQPKAIYEKSVSSARRLEGLSDFEGVVYGEEVDQVEIEENGVRFLVSIRHGQKTGFFFDQRNMRQLIGQHARGKRVLNCFSYSGGFSLFALKGAASHVTSVDICPKGNALARQNTLLNGFDLEKHKIIQEDAFDFLKHSSLDYQLVILDPPAFAKKLSDQKAACLGYKALNRLALEKMPANSLLLTCSCSYHIDGGLFQNLLFQAAQEAGRKVKIVSRHHQAYDHPISLCHPEGEYLKSLFLYIN